MSVTADEVKNPLTPEQNNQAIKEFMYQEYLKKYQELSALTNQTPFHVGLKQLVIQYLDTAFLWAKEAFQALQLPVPPIEPVVNPVAPKKRVRKKKAKKNGK